MYAKLFASLYQGTLRGQPNEILVFTNLLAHAGKDGTVDKHYKAIAEETGLDLDAVKAAIEVLEAPDPESRSPEENGARLVKMDEHRAWGWRIVNHGKYRAIRSEDDRAEQNRLSQKRWRDRHYNKQSKPSVSNDKPSKPMQMQYAESEAEAEAGAEVEKEKEKEKEAEAEITHAFEHRFAQITTFGIPREFAEMVFRDWDSRDGRDATGIRVKWPQYVSKRWKGSEGAQWKCGAHKAQHGANGEKPVRGRL